MTSSLVPGTSEHGVEGPPTPVLPSRSPASPSFVCVGGVEDGTAAPPSAANTSPGDSAAESAGSGGSNTAAGTAAGTAAASQDKQPWYRRRWVKVVAVRVLMRLTMVGILVVIGLVFSLDSVVDAYGQCPCTRLFFTPLFVVFFVVLLCLSLSLSLSALAYGMPVASPPYMCTGRVRHTHRFSEGGVSFFLFLVFCCFALCAELLACGV